MVYYGALYCPVIKKIQRQHDGTSCDRNMSYIPHFERILVIMESVFLISLCSIFEIRQALHPKCKVVMIVL